MFIIKHQINSEAKRGYFSSHVKVLCGKMWQYPFQSASWILPIQQPQTQNVRPNHAHSCRATVL